MPKAAELSQLIVTTHSPHFVDSVRAEELWVLYRDAKGYTQAKRALDMPGIRQFMDHGAKLGQLWLEGQFDVGDPLFYAGGPKDEASGHAH